MQRAESRLPAMKLPTSEETTTAGDQVAIYQKLPGCDS